MLTQTKAKIALQSKSGVAAFECSPGERLLFAGLAQGAVASLRVRNGHVRHLPRAGDGREFRDRVAGGSRGCQAQSAIGGDVSLRQTHPGSDCVVRVAANVAQVTAGPLPMRRSGRVEVARLLTPDVMTVEIELSVPMSFAAGQFVVVETPAVKGGRAYSMVNHGEEL